MDEQKKIRVLFTDKAELIFSEIIKKYNLQERDEELYKKYAEGKEGQVKIIRDAVKTIAKKIIPDEKLAELLEKHLRVSRDIINKMIQDIKSNLLPLLLMFPEEKFNDPIFREEISKKVFGEEKGTILPYDKKIEIKDVDKNAEKIKQVGKTLKTEFIVPEKENQQVQNQKPDTYRESIE